MKGIQRRLTNGVAAACASALLGATAAHADDHRSFDKIRHVLLISIDGFHAVDLEVCLAQGTCPSLAKLVAHGSTYPNASTTKPFDSFPGFLAQLTGGTSKSTGVFYDDSYDRTLFAPAGHPPQPCVTGPGAETNLAENVDVDLHQIDGGVPTALTGPNSAVAIDPNNLPGQLVNGICRPVWPPTSFAEHCLWRRFAGTTADGVVRHIPPTISSTATTQTASRPTHPAPTSTTSFRRDQLRSERLQCRAGPCTRPEIDRARSGRDACPGPNCLDFTGSIDGVEFYDGIKVQAVLNEIEGFDHTGKHYMGTPTIFGMNFQAVSVGQACDRRLCRSGGDALGQPAQHHRVRRSLDRSDGRRSRGPRPRGRTRWSSSAPSTASRRSTAASARRSTTAR